LRRNCLVKHVTEGEIEERREDDEEDIRNYRTTFRKRDYTGN
jgi:hypothetical protein